MISGTKRADEFPEGSVGLDAQILLEVRIPAAPAIFTRMPAVNEHPVDIEQDGTAHAAISPAM